MPRPAYTPAEREQIDGQIRAKALELFGRLGYRGVSLRAIAKAMGWSAPALYRYFDNKDELMAAVRADGFKALKKRLHDARLESATPVDAVRGAMAAYLQFATEEPELFRLMYELDQGKVAEYPQVVRERRSAFAEAEALAAAVIEAEGIPVDANKLAHLMWVNAHGLAALALANQLDLGQQLDDLIEPVLKVLVTGITKTGDL